MKKASQFMLCLIALSCMAVTCKKQTARNKPAPGDPGLVNTSHLDYLYTPLTFSIKGMCDESSSS